MREKLKLLFLSLLKIVLFPHIVLFLLSLNRKLIEEDLKVMNQKFNKQMPMITSLVYFLWKNVYYRNIFYSRIGVLSNICSWYLKGDKTFFPCKNLGGGIYPAHPYATILNAKKIGRNFSCRQCTTLGNKADGEGGLGPTIGDNVYVGANVCIVGDIKIGNNVVIGAGCVVTKDVPDNAVVVGNPGRILRFQTEKFDL